MMPPEHRLDWLRGGRPSFAAKDGEVQCATPGAAEGRAPGMVTTAAMRDNHEKDD